MDNLRGAAFMVISMALFSVEDAIIKHLSTTLPTGQILILLGLGGGTAFALLLQIRGERFLDPAFFNPAILLRNLGELTGTIFFVTALWLIPLSTASVILQAQPLVVTAGAAMFLREVVGWRRWTAVAVGFAGMILILRPGAAGFDPAAIFAVLGVLGLSLRDLATRRVRAAVSSVQLAAWAFFALIPAGALLLPFTAAPVLPTAGEAGLIGCIIGIGMVAYMCITRATRIGDVSFVAPFRYSRLIFALIVGGIAFGERPDAFTLIGGALIIGSGLYTFFRERRLSLTRAAA